MLLKGAVIDHMPLTHRNLEDNRLTTNKKQNLVDNINYAPSDILQL